jgi:hypothetical protein
VYVTAGPDDLTLVVEDHNLARERKDVGHLFLLHPCCMSKSPVHAMCNLLSTQPCHQLIVQSVWLLQVEHAACFIQKRFEPDLQGAKSRAAQVSR